MTSPLLRRLLAEDVAGQLLRRSGRMLELGSEDGMPRLDWVDVVARLVDDPSSGLETVEEEARAIRGAGIRHLIWAGMGGSVMAVRVVVDLGLCTGGPAVYPLDSTDPAALNAILGRIARAEGADVFALPMLQHVMMIGVAMGMTSEEPITHLAWFEGLLRAAGLDAAHHMRVMALPASYLDLFARERGITRTPLALDGGTGTPGRMSAPGTRVFLLPAALALPEPGSLRAVLRRATELYGPARSQRQLVEDPYVGLALDLSAASVGGACLLFLALPPAWRPLLPWIEQLLEESLGKGGKGVVVFEDQPVRPTGPAYREEGVWRVEPAPERLGPIPTGRSLVSPLLSTESNGERWAALAASMLGWEWLTALYGYLNDITFVGQPAVENYKRRARELRERKDPLEAALETGAVARDGALTLIAPPGSESGSSPAAAFAHLLRAEVGAGRLRYLDLTVNADLPPVWDNVGARYRTLGNELLGVPVKVRRAPAAYHSTEQSEMDGPSGVVSLRLAFRRRPPVAPGPYDDRFLRAQAAGTWAAMCEAGRVCCLLVMEDQGTASQAAVLGFLGEVEEMVR